MFEENGQKRPNVIFLSSDYHIAGGRDGLRSISALLPRPAEYRWDPFTIILILKRRWCAPR